MADSRNIDALISRAGILENRSLAADTFLMVLDSPEVAGASGPARFVKVRSWPESWEGGGPTLDRPLSIHRFQNGRLSLLYRVVGPATGLLSRARPGDEVKISGPLGRGLAENLMTKPEAIYLVGGGIGLAPLAGARDWLGPECRSTVFYGERFASAQVDENWLKSWAGEYLATVEDGNGYGLTGRVTAPLAEALQKDPRPVFACGPTPMLAAVSALCGKAGVPCLVSVEAGMACGFGVCLTCSLPLKEGGRFRVCQEGPVVDGLKVNWQGVH